MLHLRLQNIIEDRLLRIDPFRQTLPVPFTQQISGGFDMVLHKEHKLRSSKMQSGICQPV